MIDLDKMSGIGITAIWNQANVQVALSLALLACPIALTMWARRRALRRVAEEGLDSWFSYRLNHQLVTFLFVALWSALWDWDGRSIAIPLLLKFRLASLATPAAQSNLFWLLPLTFLGFNEVLFYATNRRINGLHWTAFRIFWQGMWSIVRYAIPLFLIVAGFEYIYDGVFVGIVWILLAVIVAAVGKVGLERALGFKTRRLKTGELRNRAFAMAKTMGANLREVNIVPQGKGHLTNAYAGGLGSISITDTLSQSLTYREVDCVLAHELAHVRLRHVREYFWLLTLPYIFLVLLLYGWPSRISEVRPLLNLVVILLPILILNFFSRRNEYAADRDEVAVVRDPESSIRSLAKLHRLSHVPSQWSYLSELFLSHPSLERRARAIAQAGGVSDARAEEILEEVNSRKNKNFSRNRSCSN